MIKILIDSAADINKKEADLRGIYLMPIEIRFQDQLFWDGIDISHEMFYQKLLDGEFPKTSQINEFRFADEFQKLTADGDQLIVITLSSKLSGTFANALKAARDFENKVFVVDSLNACIGERILCDYAQTLVSRGSSAPEIADELDQKKKKIRLLARLGTLKYLHKGGRISSAVAFTGEILSIKPVISVIDGEVKLVGKAIGAKKANNLLNQLVSRDGIDYSMPFALAYSGLTRELLDTYINDSVSLWKGKVNSLPIFSIGTTIGAYVGPDGIGVAFFAK